MTKIVGCAILLGLFWGCPLGLQADQSDASPHRIISLAPSITETLFALDAGPRVVGVTRYCLYPPEAQTRPQVGGYYDPSLEAILRLRPELVILPPEIYETGRQLERLHIPVMIVNQRTLAGVISSFVLLGQVCKTEAQGSHLAAQFWETCLKTRTSQHKRPRVLLVLNRDYSAQELREVYIAGRGELYDELLEMAGGQNAYSRRLPKYPRLSAEGVLALDPDLIIELVDTTSRRPPEALQNDWQSVPGLRAAAQHRVVVLVGEYLTIPGPRLNRVLMELQTAIAGITTQP